MDFKAQFKFNTNYQPGNLTNLDEIFKGFNQNFPSNKQQEISERSKEKHFFQAQKIPNVYLQTLNLRAIHNLLGKDFYQYNVMEGIQYISEELLIGRDLMETSKKVHANIGKLVALAAGANGTVSSASIGDKSNLFTIIIKNALDKNDDDLMHEAFIGLAGTNKLRKQIPNFSYIYGFFQCDGPKRVTKGKETTEFCTGNPNALVSYALYETVQGEEFGKAIAKMKADEFTNYYLQVILALNYANLVSDFTHFDLHAENIILRKLENGKHGIMYPTSTLGDIYLYTDKIPTIIDYGYSHITYKGEDYGKDELQNVKMMKSFPLFDAFKFLMFSAFRALEQNNYKVFDKCAEIARFFTDDDFEILTEDGRETYYQLPSTPKLMSLSIEPLVDWISQNVDNDIQLEASEQFPMLECTSTCLTVQAVEKEAGAK